MSTLPTHGPDGHPIPEQQGVVNAEIQPILIKDIRLGRAMAAAEGVAIHEPNFVTDLTRDADGAIDPKSIECVPLTLEKAHEAAVRIIAAMERLPVTPATADVLNIAFALLHFENQGAK